MRRNISATLDKCHYEVYAHAYARMGIMEYTVAPKVPRKKNAFWGDF